MNARSSAVTTGATLRVSELELGILGGVALVMGVVVLFAGDEQYVGLGGEASWQVGDIGLAWALGLLAMGAAIILIDVALVRWDRHRSERAVAPSGREDLIVHTAMFVLVNAFIWTQDIVLSGGVNYAWWITVPWGIGLAVHAVAVFRAGDQPHGG
jgi:hypothetical protein